MPTIPPSQLRVNQPLDVAAPDATLTIANAQGQPLPAGSYTFQLEVVDSSGNRSQATQARVIVIDNQAPTAIISAPRTVPFGTDFTLSGAESRDLGGGTIVRYIWTLIQ